jgi:hypothetical protein
MPFSPAAQASNDFFTGRAPVPTPSGGAVIAVRSAVSLGTGDLANGTVGGLAILPAGAIPVAFELDATQLDSNGTPTLAYSVGVLNAGQSAISTATADGGAAWATGQQTGRAAGGSASGIVASRPLKLVAASQADRVIGIALTGGAATPQAGVLGLTLWYRVTSR